MDPSNSIQEKKTSFEAGGEVGEIGREDVHSVISSDEADLARMGYRQVSLMRVLGTIGDGADSVHLSGIRTRVHQLVGAYLPSPWHAWGLFELARHRVARDEVLIMLSP